MGRYLTTGRCPDCQALVAQAPHCPVCGLPMQGIEVDSLRQLLAQADVVLTGLRHRAVPVQPPPVVAAPTPWTTPTPTPPSTAPGAEHPAAFPVTPLRPVRTAPPTRTFPAISTPVVLLLLGALSIFTAAVVFVTVSWSDLSLASKALILLAVTSLLGGIASWSIHRRLRGTAETFSALFVIMVVLDFLSARTGGLGGLDALPWRPTSWIAAGLMVGAATAYARAGIQSFGRLVAVQLLAGIGVLWLILLACSEWSGRVELVLLAVGAAALVLAVLAARFGIWITATLTVAYGATLLAFSLSGSITRLGNADTVADLWGRGDAVGLLIWSAIFLAAASMRVVPMLARQVTATLAVLGVLTVLLRPLEGSDIDVVVLVLVGTGLTLAWSPVVVRRLPDPWSTASTAGAVGPAFAGLVVVAPSAVWGLARIGGALEHVWTLDVADHLQRQLNEFETSPSTPITGALVMGAAVVALTATAMLVATRRRPAATVVAASVVAAAALTLMHYDLTLGVFVGVLTALTAGSALAAVWLRDIALAVVASLTGVLTVLLSLGSAETTLAVALVMAAVLTTVSVRSATAEAAQAAAGLALLAGVVVIVSFAEVAGIRPSTGGDAVAALAGAAVLIAQLRPSGRELRQRVALEVTSVAAAAVGVGLATDVPAWRLPIALTIYGAALSAVAVWRTDRRIVGYAGGLVLASATWVRLVVEDVSVVEPYTLPSALALLVAGVVRMYRTPAASLVVLSPGLSLAFLPSLLVALEDPTSARALCVIVAGAAAVVVGAYQRWAAPMVYGGGSAGLLLLVNLAPYAQALPRWVLFAVVGAGLLYLGVTWEQRLRNLRRLALSLERIR
jgi:hypothetical protein